MIALLSTINQDVVNITKNGIPTLLDDKGKLLP